MTVRRVLRLGNPGLRAVASPVPPGTIASDDTQRLIDDLVETMRDYEGVGIAAPQVGVSLRIFVMEVSQHNSRYPGKEGYPLTVFVNPTLTPLDERSVHSEEACLSIPGLRGLASRHGRVRVQGMDRSGNDLDHVLDGFPAIVSQHEFDHLEGFLYVDRLWTRGAFGFEDEVRRHESLSLGQLAALGDSDGAPSKATARL